MKKGLIVYISSIPWDYSWHRQQEMMKTISKDGYKILFVEPSKKRINLTRKIIKVEDNITRLIPVSLPFERCSRMINKLNSKFSKYSINMYLKKSSISRVLFWLDRVHGFDFSFYRKRYMIVYDLIDEILSFGRMKNKTMLIELENKVLNNVDLIISSSQTLLDRKKIQSKTDVKSLFIPNGVSLSRFKGLESKCAFHDIHKPIIGFVGDISKRRIDFPLIKEVARENKDVSFVFVGPGDVNDKRELKENNIFVFDAVSGEEIPKIISSFDVGMIPYNVNTIDMNYIFPRKACEYLASGKPVISTPMNELKCFHECIEIVANANEFNAAIKKIFSHKIDVQNRVKIAEKYDWNYLMKNVKYEIENLMEGR